MLRLRRYRVFVVFAIVALGLFYHFKGVGYTQSSIAASVSSLKHSTGQGKASEKSENPPSSDNSNDRFNGLGEISVSSDAQSLTVSSSAITVSTSAAAFNTAEEAFEQLNHGLQDIKFHSSSSSLQGGHSVSQSVGLASKDSVATAQASPTSSPRIKTAHYQRPSTKAADVGHNASKAESQEKDDGEAVLSEASTLPKIHWSRISEHFPVPTASLIPVPTGNAKLPKIQYDFGSTPGAGQHREQDKLDAIKKSFQFSWAGYREKAWMQDELSPKSGKYRNPFCSWGATLVDSVDSLWIMDLKDEFEDAVDAIKKIDFTTSSRNDIPLFETVIRYLGGLIGAYDISGGKYEVLLQKAVELADVLMGAFDTPNRMPMTFYLWKPTFASQPHRAKTRVVMAELGSLTLEFTRLAQITKQAKYYDAVARITNEFALWQNHTKVPGLWPLKVDASGCRKPEPSPSDLSISEDKPSKDFSIPSPNNISLDLNAEHSNRSSQRGQSSRNSTTMLPNAESEDRSAALPSSTDDDDDAMAVYNPKGHIEKRENSVGPGHDDTAPTSTTAKCEPQGLVSPPYSEVEEFSLGGLADSTYEYLPKEYILLNGLEPKYRSMYESAAEAAKKHLIYRPMIPDANRSILQAGLLKSTGRHDPDALSRFDAEGTHLTCFAGGMFALGAKIFERKDDLDIASKLTDGCVWAYEATKSGMMPEIFLTIRCKETESCSWNETLWLEALDPYGASQSMAKSGNTKQLVLSESTSVKDGPIEGTGQVHNSRHNDTVTAARTSNTQPSPFPQQVSKTNAENTESEGKDQSKNVSMQTEKVAEGLAQLPSLVDKHQSPALSTPGAPPQKSEPKKALGRRQLGEIDEQIKFVDEKATLRTSPTGNDFAIGNSDANMSNDAPSEREQDKVLYKDSKVEPESKPKQKPTVGTNSSTSATIRDTPLLKESSALEHMKTNPKIDEDGDSQSPISSKTASPTKVSAEGGLSEGELADESAESKELPLGMTKIVSSRYLLRPEAIESVFIMYRITGDEYWRKKGWKMFLAIEKHTKSTFGASAISDVNSENPKQLDEMESFWLAETLKYFYLLFSDPDTLSLDDFVFNTEAHPLQRPK